MNRLLLTMHLLTLTLLVPAISLAEEAPAPESFLAQERPAQMPLGFYDFCKRDPSQCNTKSPLGERLQYSPDVMKKLISVNKLYNEKIEFHTDYETYGWYEYWAINQKYGDGEDYALTKRDHLIKKLGWPASALTIAVVTDPWGRDFGGETYHGILIVRTSQGDFVLDNLTGEVKLWSETDYDYFKGQSPFHTQAWSFYTNKTAKYFCRHDANKCGEP